MSCENTLCLTSGKQASAGSALSPGSRVFGHKKTGFEAVDTENKFTSTQGSFFIQYTSLILILLCVLIAHSSMRSVAILKRGFDPLAEIKYLGTEIKLDKLIVNNQINTSELQVLKDFLANHDLNLMLEIEARENLPELIIRLSEALNSLGFWEDSFTIRGKNCQQDNKCSAHARLSWSSK